MAQGYSFKAFAGLLGVNRSTLYDWVDAHPEFKDAKEIGESKSEYKWEQLAMQGAQGQIEKWSVGTFVFTMKNRFGWRDKQELEVSGKGGKPLIPSKPITPEELAAALAMDSFIDVTPTAKALPEGQDEKKPKE